MLKTTAEQLRTKGADKFSLSLMQTETQEFNLVYKELNLLRSMQSTNLGLTVIKDQKQASTVLNQLDPEAINSAIDTLMQNVIVANPDPAFDISPFQDPVVGTGGVLQGDFDKLCERLQEFAAQMISRYPSVQFDATMTYRVGHRYYTNSNGVDFEFSSGFYSFVTMFTAKESNKTSSMNYNGFSIADLDQDLLSLNFTEDLIKQSIGQTETKAIPENFVGDVIFFPFVGVDLLETMLDGQIGDGALIRKTSKYPDHLGQKLFDEKLTIHTRPHDERFCAVSPITSDGFLAPDATIVENGVLKHYPITIFAANKTGKERTVGDNGNLVIQNGNIPFAEMIKGIDKGIYCVRASYGNPNANGDFSAVLKNSYYIENGKLAYPISETMISANLIEMFNNIKAISAETINTGSSIIPFMQIGNIHIAPK